MTPRHLPLKSNTVPADQPSAADAASPAPGAGEPKGVGRKAVRSAVGSAPQRECRQVQIGALRITAPPFGDAIPTGASWCACGHRRTAVGRARVLALIQAHHDHKAGCSLHNPPERRRAA
jgi:hypothetical protein